MTRGPIVASGDVYAVPTGECVHAWVPQPTLPGANRDTPPQHVAEFLAAFRLLYGEHRHYERTFD